MAKDMEETSLTLYMLYLAADGLTSPGTEASAGTVMTKIRSCIYVHWLIYRWVSGLVQERREG